MALMYDTIMELPLFKGIGVEQLSLMLEKTSIEFLKFTDGEVIAEAHESVKAVDFIIKGNVLNIYKMENFPIEIHETLEKGNMIGATRLYGLTTDYGARSVAVGDVSLMRIEKSQYMNILLSDRIYILNFVNLLSASTQKNQMMMLEQGKPSIARTLDTLVYTVTSSKRTEKVKVVGSDEALAAYCGVSVETFRKFREGNDAD